MIIEFDIPGHPPSANRLARAGRGRFYKPSKYIYWEKIAESVVLKHPFGFQGLQSLGDKPYHLEIEVFASSWVQKNGLALKKPDISNLIKSTEDSICKVVGWKDQNALSVHASKVEAEGADHTVVRFKFVERYFTPQQ